MLVQVLLCVAAVAPAATFAADAPTRAGDGLFDDHLLESSIDQQLCAQHLQQMNSFEFYDASFRFPQGFLTGNLGNYGNYFQCLNIKQELSEIDVVEGKHCMIEIPLGPDAIEITLPPLPGVQGFHLSNQSELARTLRADIQLKRSVSLLSGLMKQDEDTEDSEAPGTRLMTAFNLGVCIPKSCSVQQALKPFFDNALVIVNYSELRCRVPNDKPYVAADYVAIVIFSLIGIVTILSTGYELRHLFILKQDALKLSPLFSCCSMYSNTKQLFTFPHNPRALHCLDGIRSISIMWIIIGHTSLTMYSAGISNLIAAIEWYQDIRAVWLTSANICVDTFFMLSGLLLVYTSVSKLTKMSLLKNVHLYYLNRYLRMFPILATAVLLQATLFHRVTDGANWSLESTFVQLCRENWWAALLHIQNYYNPLEECLPHTWYLSVDFQLHLLSPLVLVWLLGGRRAAWIVLGGIFSCTMIITTTFIFSNNFASNMFTGMDISYFKWYYVNTFTRAPTFLVGMIFGYLLHVCRGKDIKLPLWFVSVCWASSVAVMSCAIYVYLPQNQFDYHNQTLANFANSFNRTMWCIAMGWVIFACVHGYGGPVNWFLSLTMWKLVAKLSYALYIFHYPLQFIKASAVISPKHFSLNNLWMSFFEEVVVTVMLSIAVCVLVDAPFAQLQKILLGPDAKKAQPSQKMINGADKTGDDNKDNMQHKTV